MSVEHRVRPEVRAMVRPRHGGDVWGRADVRDYSSNVNPLGPPARLYEYMAGAANDMENYPDDSCAELKEAIARRYDVRADNIMMGAGSAELIRLFPEVFVHPGDRVVMPRPTFSEYGFACRLMGARLIDLPLPEDDAFRLDVDDLIGEMVPGTRAVYVCNPNNPTARMLSRGEVLELVEEASRRDIMFFLDETLLELSERDRDVSCVGEVEAHDNLFIIRSFTKSFAMPGMRIGYGFGSREVVRYMDAARLSWNLGTLEQRVAARLMNEEQDHVRRAVAMLVEEKERMRHQISLILDSEVRLPDSYFFFHPLNGMGLTSPQFREAMLRQNVLVRDCSSFGPPCGGYSRFCVKTRDKNEEFLSALRSVVEGIGGGR
ncbi:MAG: histidinol-phosphate aminotransferase family protein [Methanomassiliicoccus sp.]|nr:histidinol-phosphate aminotransferase family protein [Methanomassiliicoccus sp.]